MENNRLKSLDAMRGFDMLFIMGFASLLIAVCKLWHGGGECFLAVQMKHVSEPVGQVITGKRFS